MKITDQREESWRLLTQPAESSQVVLLSDGSFEIADQLQSEYYQDVTRIRTQLTMTAAGHVMGSQITIDRLLFVERQFASKISNFGWTSERLIRDYAVRLPQPVTETLVAVP